VANDDGGDGEKEGGSSVWCVMTTAGSKKRQACPPSNYFKRLHEVACPNHTCSRTTAS
jgi:hypothetical protein